MRIRFLPQTAWTLARVNRGIVAGLILVAALLPPWRLVGASVETPSAFESNPQGWTDILPAPDLTGWLRVSVQPTIALGRQQWHVDTEKKMLICDGDGG